MANNLVSLVMQFLTPDVITKIASALGLDRAIAQKAITGAVPSLLAGLADVASTPGGVRQLSNAAAQQQPWTVDSPKNLIGSGQNAFADTGSSLLTGLFGGDTLQKLAHSIGKFAGVSEGTSKSLLSMLGPVVLGALSQQQRTAGLDASGLASLLTSQKDQLASVIPSDLADQLNVAGLIDKLGGGGRSGTAAASATASAIGNSAERMAHAASSQAAQAARSASSSSWPLWMFGLVALGGLAWYFLSSPAGDKLAELPRPTVTTPGGQIGTVGLGTARLTVGDVDLGSQVTSSVGALRTTLAGISDAASAQAALPKIRETMAQLDEVGTLSANLPAEVKKTLAMLIATAMPAISQLCDKILATPGVGGIAKPTIDQLRSKLDTLARA